MLTANYHTHTYRCRHAEGTEREYVETAIQGGLKILGFSDHTPYPFQGGYYSTFRMRMDELENYVTTIERLKKEYRGEIEIHLGLEAEYYPAYFEALLRTVADYPMEYLILGQHYLENERGAFYSGAGTDDPALLCRYCAQTKEAMRTGKFLYLAHPDLFDFHGDPAVYDREMRSLCREANRLSMPLEINFQGMRYRRNYPEMRFWQLAAEEGSTAVFGLDAHKPQDMWEPELEEKARAIAAAAGIRVIDTLQLSPSQK